MTRGVDSGEKTFHTTFVNKCKFSWESKARRITLLAIISSFRKRQVTWRQTSFKSTDASFI